MECTFLNGFEHRKSLILEQSTEVKHLIKMGDDLTFIKGQYANINGFDHIFCKYIHSYRLRLLKEYDLKGIFVGGHYLFDKRKSEYIIKIEDNIKYQLSKPLELVIDESRREFHSGYYGCGKTIGLSFNSDGRIGFLPDTYIPMLEGKIYDSKYRIEGEEWVRNFLIEKCKV